MAGLNHCAPLERSVDDDGELAGLLGGPVDEGYGKVFKVVVEFIADIAYAFLPYPYDKILSYVSKIKFKQCSQSQNKDNPG